MPHGPMGAERPLVYNHLAKTGGTFVKNMMLGMFGKEITILEEWQGVKSLGLPTSGPTRPFVIGAIRDPCDYYVSLWTFSSGGTVDIVVKSVPGLSDHFGKSKESGFTSKSDLQRFRRWLRDLASDSLNLLSARFWFSYFKAGNPCMPWKGEVCAGKTSKFEGMADEINGDLAAAESLHDIADCWIRTENLNEDLEMCLKIYEEEAGVALDWELFEELKAKKIRNKSERKSCDIYYDDVTRNIVAKKDRHVARLFGYDSCCSGSTTVGPMRSGNVQNRTDRTEL